MLFRSVVDIYASISNKGILFNLASVSPNCRDATSRLPSASFQFHLRPPSPDVILLGLVESFSVSEASFASPRLLPNGTPTINLPNLWAWNASSESEGLSPSSPFPLVGYYASVGECAALPHLCISCIIFGCSHKVSLT